MENEPRINHHCVMAQSSEPETSDLFNPRAFTPAELKRIALGQIMQGREIHILIQRTDGVLDKTYYFSGMQNSLEEVSNYAERAKVQMEHSDGFYFQSPTDNPMV